MLPVVREWQSRPLEEIYAAGKLGKFIDVFQVSGGGQNIDLYNEYNRGI